MNNSSSNNYESEIKKLRDELNIEKNNNIALKIWKCSPNPKLKKFKYIKCSNALWHNKYLKKLFKSYLNIN